MTSQTHERGAARPSDAPTEPTGPSHGIGNDNATAETEYAAVTAAHKNSKKWTPTSFTFSELVAMAEEPADRKECGNYLMGTLRGEYRRKETIVSRSMLQLDADLATEGTWSAILDLPFKALVHTTFSSTPDELHLRLIVPLDREASPDEYRRAVQELMDQLGAAAFDPGSVQPERYMFRPAANPKHREHYRARVVEGPIARLDDLLSQAPAAEALDGDIISRERRDPGDAPGVVGAFNRAYSISEAIPEFGLPYRRASSDRWHYTRGDGTAGLHEFRPGLVTAHQTSDPAHGEARSAFDLVRVHLYGTLDENSAPGTPIHQLPSHGAMVKHVQDDPRMIAEMETDDPPASAHRKTKGPSAAARLVATVGGQMRFLASDAGTGVFAASIRPDGSTDGEVMWAGDGTLARKIRADAYRATGETLSANTINDALETLSALAEDAPPVRVARRVAETDAGACLNLGRGRLALVTADRWELTDRAPEGTFYRTSPAMAPQVDPVAPGEGSLAPLWAEVNIPESARPLVLGWLLMALLYPDSAQVVLLLTGGKGSGKSETARRLKSLIDPAEQNMLLTRMPGDHRSYVSTAIGRWVMAIDNLSHLTRAQSDLLATTATGIADETRTMRTNYEQSSAAMKNPLILTAITLSGAGSDLQDRTVELELPRLPHQDDDGDRAKTWNAGPRAVVLGGLLDLAVAVLDRARRGHLPTPAPFRIRKYAQTVAIVDEILGTDGTGALAAGQLAAARSTVEGSLLLTAIESYVREPMHDRSAGELKQFLDDAALRYDVTRDADTRMQMSDRKFAAELRRAKEDLERLGWTVTRREPWGKANRSTWTLIPPGEGEAGDEAGIA